MNENNLDSITHVLTQIYTFSRKPPKADNNVYSNDFGNGPEPDERL